MELAFDNDVVQQHPIYPKCHSTLYLVSKEDYPHDNFFDNDIECLDMDAYETAVCHGKKDRTVDAVIGVCKYERNRFTSSCLLLVELRMDYKSPKNLSRSKLMEKVRHTKELLGMDIPIYGTYYFVFRCNIINQVRRRFEDEKRECGEFSNYEAKSTDEFTDMVKDKSKYPYRPINDIVQIEKYLRELIGKCDYNRFFEEVEKWCIKTRGYFDRYNLQEYNVLSSMLKDVWKTFDSARQSILEEDKFYSEYLEDSYIFLR